VRYMDCNWFDGIYDQISYQNGSESKADLCKLVFAQKCNEVFLG